LVPWLFVPGNPFIFYNHLTCGLIEDIVLAKPNYSFEKRQRDLEKKRKQEEKRLKKLADKKPAADGSNSNSDSDSGSDPSDTGAVVGTGD